MKKRLAHFLNFIEMVSYVFSGFFCSAFDSFLFMNIAVVLAFNYSVIFHYVNMVHLMDVLVVSGLELLQTNAMINIFMCPLVHEGRHSLSKKSC